MFFVKKIKGRTKVNFSKKNLKTKIYINKISYDLSKPHMPLLNYINNNNL